MELDNDMALDPETMRVDCLYHYCARIVRVVDGDTVRADIDLGDNVWSLDKSVRLALVDTPELRGIEAARGAVWRDFVFEWFESRGPGVIIQSLKRDSFGRWLAVVWSAKTGECLNEHILSMGRHYGLDLRSDW